MRSGRHLVEWQGERYTAEPLKTLYRVRSSDSQEAPCGPFAYHDLKFVGLVSSSPSLGVKRSITIGCNDPINHDDLLRAQLGR